jgi:hypothetical protein
MDADEREVTQYLQTWGTAYVHGKEIARRANKRRFSQEPDWAKPVLERLEERGVIESDHSGRYRLKPEKHDKSHKWIAPDINKILQEGGLEVEGAAHIPTHEDSEPL